MKVAYDSCLYIDFLREGSWSELFCDRSHTRFLSPIVILELNAGVNTPTQRKSLDRLFYPYSKARRIIGLHSNDFYKAGEVISRCRRKVNPLPKGFSHDVLLAISALTAGATLFTRDQDFKMIRDYVPLRLTVV